MKKEMNNSHYSNRVFVLQDRQRDTQIHTKSLVPFSKAEPIFQLHLVHHRKWPFWPCFYISVGDTVELTAERGVEAWCGQNVTMTCDVTIPDPGGIKLFKWIANNKTCEYEKDHADTKVVCESEPSRLSMTVLNVMPGDQGDYLCKVHSKTGAKTTKTVLTIPSVYIFTLYFTKNKLKTCCNPPELKVSNPIAGCYNPSLFLVNESQAMCCFTGVYPHGFIHWFQRDVNLTDSAVRQPDEVDQEGRYGVCSTLPARSSDLSLPFTCLLWSPAKSSYLFRVVKQYVPTDRSVPGGTVSLRANLTVVLIMAAAAIKGSFQRLMMQWQYSHSSSEFEQYQIPPLVFGFAHKYRYAVAWRHSGRQRMSKGRSLIFFFFYSLSILSFVAGGS